MDSHQYYLTSCSYRVTCTTLDFWTDPFPTLQNPLSHADLNLFVSFSSKWSVTLAILRSISHYGVRILGSASDTSRSLIDPVQSWTESVSRKCNVFLITWRELPHRSICDMRHALVRNKCPRTSNSLF